MRRIASRREFFIFIIVYLFLRAAKLRIFTQLCIKFYHFFADFLANKTENELFIDMSLTIRKIINATIAMVFRLIFKVGLTFIKGAKKGKEDNQTQDKNAAQTAETKIG